MGVFRRCSRRLNCDRDRPRTLGLRKCRPLPYPLGATAHHHGSNQADEAPGEESPGAAQAAAAAAAASAASQARYERIEQLQAEEARKALAAQRRRARVVGDDDVDDRLKRTGGAACARADAFKLGLVGRMHGFRTLGLIRIMAFGLGLIGIMGLRIRINRINGPPD